MNVNPAMRWTMSLPVPVEFGAGCIQKLGSYVKDAKKALVISGLAGTQAAVAVDWVCEAIENAGVEPQVFDKISTEPHCEEVEEGGAAARKFGADLIIGCGGGSAMDAAKAIAVAATHDGPIMDYQVGGPREITAATLPIIAITTTSGTGSHVGRVSVVADTAKSQKRPLGSDYLYPRAGFCDPEILRLMPPRITASSGFDAFAQSIESYLSQVEQPMGSICGQEAIRIIAQVLPTAFKDGNNLEARAAMGWADTLSAISFTTQGVLIPHVIGMVIGGRYGIAHGPAVGATTLAALRFCRDGATGKLANVARLMGCTEALSEEELADWAIDAIESLITSLDIPKSVSAYNILEKDFESIAKEVYADFRYRVDANPVPTDVAGLVEILRMSAAMA
ncbi:MAG: iron-containing alcohol dehydrogenase [Armatimonadetes bacterium]|nr:iron-containing alcohol dehydrogenase [Armatimonadota bacterium]